MSDLLIVHDFYDVASWSSERYSSKEVYSGYIMFRSLLMISKRETRVDDLGILKTATDFTSRPSQRIIVSEEISATELEQYVIRDKQKIAEIMALLKKIKPSVLKPGILVEVSEGVYIGLTKEGDLKIVVL